MQLGIDCARAGAPPLFCPEALVSSRFPANEHGRRSQRTRWEHGHLAMIFGAVPRLLLDGVRNAGSGLAALTFDLLALLVLISVALAALCAAHALGPRRLRHWRWRAAIWRC